MFRQIRTFRVCLLLLGLNSVSSVVSASSSLDSCPGYNAVNVQVTETDLTADLILAGEPCGIYGPEIQKLALLVQTQSGPFLLAYPVICILTLEQKTRGYMSKYMTQMMQDTRFQKRYSLDLHNSLLQSIRPSNSGSAPLHSAFPFCG